jgi:methylated-DNA-[protein]-cysteine S-methyltransferase
LLWDSEPPRLAVRCLREVSPRESQAHQQDSQDTGKWFMLYASTAGKAAALRSLMGVGGWGRELGRLSLMEAYFHYTLVPSAFGTLALVWRKTETGALVQQVFLPRPGVATETLVRREFAGALPGSCPAIVELSEGMQRFLGGEAVQFGLEAIALERCSAFQQRVLRAEHGIPRGWVSTYGRIARHVGVPTAARAVGRALATNPFPIIVPCHRAIRADGDLGGFQGGVRMKRALLESEGVRFSAAGKVMMTRVYYEGGGHASRRD